MKLDKRKQIEKMKKKTNNNMIKYTIYIGKVLLLPVECINTLVSR